VVAALLVLTMTAPGDAADDAVVLLQLAPAVRLQVAAAVPLQLLLLQLRVLLLQLRVLLLQLRVLLLPAAALPPAAHAAEHLQQQGGVHNAQLLHAAVALKQVQLIWQLLIGCQRHAKQCCPKTQVTKTCIDIRKYRTQLGSGRALQLHQGQ
jgi:hypothetical protein